jgi:drug/metabolite transporter (DMT)-like permease
MRIKQTHWAYIYLVIAELAVGISVVAGKFVAEYMHIYMFIGARFLISSVMLGTAMLTTRQTVVSVHHPAGRLSRQEWGLLVLQGLTGGMLFNVFFYFGVGYTTATSAGIIGSTLPAMMAVCAYFMLKEAFNVRKIVALGLAILGTLVITLDNAAVGDIAGEDILGGYFGDILVFIAMFPEALYTIFGKLLGNKVTALGAATFVNVFSFIALLPFFCYGIYQTDVMTLSGAVWFAILMGGLSGMVFFWSWSKAMVNGASVTSAALCGGLMPVFTALIACAVLHEKFSAYSAVGMLCVFASLAVGAGLVGYRLRSKTMVVESDETCEPIS